MAYRYRSQRYSRKYAQKSKRNLAATLIIVALLLYVTISWILPSLVNGIGFVKTFLNPSKTKSTSSEEDSSLAPPVLIIPYEATNSSKINISGYSTPKTKIDLYLDDDLVETEDVSEDGTFTFKDIPLSLGINNIYGKTTDSGKSSLPSKNIRLIFDNEKPNLEISEPEDGKVVTDRKIKVSGKVEINTKVFINDSQVIVDSEGSFSKEFQLNDGENSFNIKAIDEASNTNEVSRVVTFKP